MKSDEGHSMTHCQIRSTHLVLRKFQLWGCRLEIEVDSLKL